MPFKRLGLHDELTRAIADLGFTRPTPIQEQAIPPALEGRDVVGVAQTGTGKTAAYVLPLCHRMLARPGHGTRALILTPTRELTQQIELDIREFTKYTRLKGASIFGGVGFDHQRRALLDGVDLIVATPGRLLDHMRRGHAKFTRLEALVLDEADRMLDMGFMPDVLRILERLPKHRQTLLFSATMPPAIVTLAREHQRDPIMIEVARPATPAAGIRHAVYPVEEGYKLALLMRLLAQPEMRQVLVFVGRRDRAEKVKFGLDIRGVNAAALHSDRNQKQRDGALDHFRRGEVRVLVATDLAQRGLDVENISHVINYDVPRTTEEYVHRVGRTARAEAVGDAFTFASFAEEPQMRAIERTLGQPLPRVILPDFNYGPIRPSAQPFTPPPRRRRR